MPRLGELLRAEQLIDTDRLDQALRTQVVWGGRLGTNLIELGAIDLDTLTRILGQQHAVPAALARHFDKADPELQALLPAELARQFSVVPLVRLSPARVAVVSVDPLSKAALEAVAAVYGVDPREGIVYSVAAEMRVLYHLERVYKIERPTRYKRSRGKTIPPVPFDSIPVEVDSDSDLAIPISVDESAHPTGRAELADQVGSADDIAAMIDQAIENVIVPTPDAAQPLGRDRRTYVRTLGDHDDEGRAELLGRIAIKRVTVSTSAPTMKLETVPPAAPMSLVDAARAIKRGPNRDRVAQLVIEALEHFVPACDAALLLVIRGELAIGWKHFARGHDTTPEIGVPLDQPGLVADAFERGQPLRGRADDLRPIDRLLLREMGSEHTELVVAPVLIGTRVMCLVAAATEADADAAPVEAVASAAGAAFARLIRNASR